MREAYSHEVSSAGFWPGGSGTDHAAFYSYAYPVPTGFRHAAVRPAEAFFSEPLGEFLLPYDAVRTADDPEAALLDFLQSTYEAAARSANWDRAALECPRGRPVRAPRCLGATRRRTSTSSVNRLIHRIFGGNLMTQYRGFGLWFGWRRSTSAAVLCTALAVLPAMLNGTPGRRCTRLAARGAVRRAVRPRAG